MTMIPDEQLPVGTIEPMSSEEKKLRELRNRFAGHQGFYNAKDQLFKLQLTDEDLLSGEWRHISRQERRRLYRHATKQEMKRITKETLELQRKAELERREAELTDPLAGVREHMQVLGEAMREKQGYE